MGFLARGLRSGRLSAFRAERRFHICSWSKRDKTRERERERRHEGNTRTRWLYARACKNLQPSAAGKRLVRTSDTPASFVRGAGRTLDRSSPIRLEDPSHTQQPIAGREHCRLFEDMDGSCPSLSMAWAFSLWCLLWRLLALDVGVHGQTEIQDTFCNGRGIINSNLTCSCFSGFCGPNCSLSESYVYRTISHRREWSLQHCGCVDYVLYI